MKKALIVSFLVFPLITIVLMGDLSILLMPCMCLVWGISVFPGFALMHVLSRLFRSPEGMFCWIPLLNWNIVMAVHAWVVIWRIKGLFFSHHHLPAVHSLALLVPAGLLNTKKTDQISPRDTSHVL